MYIYSSANNIIFCKIESIKILKGYFVYLVLLIRIEYSRLMRKYQ